VRYDHDEMKARNDEMKARNDEPQEESLLWRMESSTLLLWIWNSSSRFHWL
jgi:hypothetical protein